MKDVEAVIDMVKWMKEERVKDAFAETDKPAPYQVDLSPTVVFWRAGREIATAHALTVNRDTALNAARIGVAGYGADVVCMVSDAYMATPKWFADRKRGPKAGELGRVFLKGRTDLVTESLATNWVDRIGGIGLVNMPYQVDYVERRIRWLERNDLDVSRDGAILTGMVPDVLRACFTQEQAMLKLHDWGFDPADWGLSDQQARMEGDTATTRLLLRFGVAVHMACYTEEQAERLRRAMDADSQVRYYAVGPDGERFSKE